eukprot:50201_1
MGRAVRHAIYNLAYLRMSRSPWRNALAAVQADQPAILEEARLQIVGEPVVRAVHSGSHGLLDRECDRRRAADHRASTGSPKDQSPIRSKNNADLNNVILPEFDGMLTLRKIYWIMINNDLCQKK